ncbi:MAG: hypothetical protein WDN46_06640 [Methylocella sp.]
MEYCYIDTALLAIPNYAVDTATAEELIDRVTHFANLASANVPVTLVIASNAEEILWSGNCSPEYSQIQAFIDLMGLGHVFAAADLVRQYQAIFSRSARADSVEPVEVHEISGFESVPPLPIGLALQSETERIFAAVAARQLLEDAWNVGSAIQGVYGRSYFTTVQIEMVSGSRAAELGNLPVTIATGVKTFSHLRELVSEESAYRLWMNAKTPEDLHFAFTIGALALLKEAGKISKVSQLRRFAIGPEFMKSLQATQCFGAGHFASAARSLCVQIVANVCAKRFGEMGRPQTIRKFDSAAGWRVHLTKGGEGFRLMFWQSNKEIEFANVGVKHELKIAHGFLNGAITADVSECLEMSGLA